MLMTKRKNTIGRERRSRHSANALLEALEPRTLFSLLGFESQIGVPQASVLGADGTITYSAANHTFDATGVPTDIFFNNATDPNVTGASDFQLHISVANNG